MSVLFHKFWLISPLIVLFEKSCCVVWNTFVMFHFIYFLWFWLCSYRLHYRLYDTDMMHRPFIYTLDGLDKAFVLLLELLFCLTQAWRWFYISSCLMRFDEWDVFIGCELCKCIELFFVTNCCIQTLLLCYSKRCCAISVSTFLMVLALHTNDTNVPDSCITAHFVSSPEAYTVAHHSLIFTVFNIVRFKLYI